MLRHSLGIVTLAEENRLLNDGVVDQSAAVDIRVDACKGEYFKVLDADAVWRRHFLLFILDVQTKNG